jgi:hypothetical protein
VDAHPDSGFFHVRMEDDQVGCVWSKFISVSHRPALPLPSAPGTPAPISSQCDASFWNHVYDSQRLIVNQQCVPVTGTIVDASGGKRRDGVRHEKDGDTHGWPNVDSEFQHLLNAENMSDEVVLRKNWIHAKAGVAVTRYSCFDIHVVPVGEPSDSVPWRSTFDGARESELG